MPTEIAVILPSSACFSSSEGANSICLCVSDFVGFSRFKKKSKVYGKSVREPLLPNNFHPIELTDRKRSKSLYYKKILGALQNKPLRLIQVQQDPSCAAFLARHLPDIPILLHRHDAQVPRSPLKRLKRDRGLRKVTGIIANSRYIADTLSHQLKHKHPPISLVYNGIDTAQVVPADNKEDLIFCVAARSAHKGPDIFIEAAIQFLDKFANWKAVLVSPKNSRTSESYQNRINSLSINLPNRFQIIDELPHPELMNYLSRARIAVVPSRCDEAFGRTALEAMAAGCAVISSGTGGLREVTKELGTYPDTNTAKKYTEAILELAANTQRIDQLGVASRRRAKELFDTQIIAAVYDKIMNNYMNQKTLSLD